MKKFKSILALTASVLALSAFAAPVSAFAETQGQTATHNQTASYTVTIPSSVTINQLSGTNYINDAAVTVSATYKLGVGDTLVVGAASNGEEKLTHATDADLKVPYTATINGATIFDTNAVFNITGDGSAETTVDKDIDYSAVAADFTKVGTYTDTITFTIAYTAAG